MGLEVQILQDCPDGVGRHAGVGQSVGDRLMRPVPGRIRRGLGHRRDHPQPFIVAVHRRPARPLSVGQSFQTGPGVPATPAAHRLFRQARRRRDRPIGVPVGGHQHHPGTQPHPLLGGVCSQPALQHRTVFVADLERGKSRHGRLLSAGDTLVPTANHTDTTSAVEH